MSAKLRITAWITLMMLLLAALTLVFVLVVNHNAITDDPAGRLVKVVQKNVDNVEFDRGKFEWDDLSMHSRGVYCMFYDTDGEFIRGAKPESFDENTPLDPNVAENHQYHNAMALVNNNAARIIEEKDLTDEKLLEVVTELLDNKELRDEIASNAKKMSKPDAQNRIADIIVKLANEK